MPRVPIYPTQPARFPSPRSGLTEADVIAAHAPTKRAGTHTEPGSGEKPARLKSAAEEFRQSIRIDIGGLEMRAQEGKGSRCEAARKFCELQHSLVALTTTSAEDKLAALADIDAAVNALDARFPGVFAGARDLVVSARETILISEEIKRLKTDFDSADLEKATWLLDGRSNVLGWQISGGLTDGPFKDRLRDEIYNCWLEVKLTHSDKHVCELLGKHLTDYPPTRSRSEGAASASSGSSPSANDIASLRAAESTKVTLPPLKMHVEPAGASPVRAGRSSRSSETTEQAAAILERVRGVQGLGSTVELVAKVANLSGDIDKLLEELLPLHSSHLSDRLLTGEVAMLIDHIALHGGPGEAALFARLGRGLDELRLTHKDPQMRAEMSRVLACCFEPGDTQPTRAITGERRLRMRVAFLLAEGPKMAPEANQCLENFAFMLVDDIKRDIGEDSSLMLHLLDELDGLPALNQLGEAIYQRSW